MGNEASGYTGSIPDPPLQSQDLNSAWTVVRKIVEDGEVCEFSHRLDGSIRDDLCKAAVEHLRILRHPNVLKFLGSDPPNERILMMTEVVVPLAGVLEKLNTEAVILGWKDILQGLDFLHTRAKLSHNNLHVGCVYISAANSRWKIGGFETAQLHSKMDSTFLSSIAAYRHPRAIPPEDKVSTTRSGIPFHSRDVWGCGQLILDLPKSASGLATTILRYIQEEMLNQDPLMRPAPLTVSQQSWMHTPIVAVTDFLTRLTLYSAEDKQTFFDSLLDRLRALPPKMVAVHIVPLLITPLVVTETADHPFWWAIFTSEPPATAAVLPLSEALTSSMKPLFTQDLFVTHVIPLLLSLLESRDKHVRLLLLKYLRVFAPLFKNDDLKAVVLPEVLVGLRDSCDEIVSSTLHTLGDLVPLLGAKAVVGNPGRPIFAGSVRVGKPATMEATSTRTPVAMATLENITGADLPSPSISTASSDTEKGAGPEENSSASKLPAGTHHEQHRGKREEQRARREEQRARREEQRAKATHTPLKLATCTSVHAAGDKDTPFGREVLTVVEQGPYQPSTDQGSSVHSGPPSANQLTSSADQKLEESTWNELNSSEEEPLDIEGKSLDDANEAHFDEEKSPLEEGKSQLIGGDPTDEQSGFLKPVALHNSMGSQSSFGVADSSMINGPAGVVATTKSPDATRASRNDISEDQKAVSTGTKSEDVGNGNSSRPEGTAGHLSGSQTPASLRGWLSEEDRERLELKSMWSKEPDVFAELGMAPNVQPVIPASLPNQKEISTALTYQAPTGETIGEEWGGGWEDWGSS